MKLVLTYATGAVDICAEVVDVSVKSRVEGTVGRTVDYYTRYGVAVVNGVIKAVLDGEVLFAPPQPCVVYDIKPPIEVSNTLSPYQALRVAVNADPELQWGWYCTLKMPMVDEGVDREVASRAVCRALSITFGVDITKHPLYIKERSENNSTTVASEEQYPPKGSLFDCVKTGKPFESASQTFKATEYVYAPIGDGEEWYDSLAELKEKYPEAIQARRYKKEYVKCSAFVPDMGDVLHENAAASNEFDDYIEDFMQCKPEVLQVLNQRVEAVVDAWATEYNQHPRFFRLAGGERVSAIEVPFKKRWG